MNSNVIVIPFKVQNNDETLLKSQSSIAVLYKEVENTIFSGQVTEQSKPSLPCQSI